MSHLGQLFESDQVVNWTECERLLPHALAVAGHGQKLEVESERWLWLLAQSATYLWSRGQHQQALTLEEQTLTTYRRVLGENHPDTRASKSTSPKSVGNWRL